MFWTSVPVFLVCFIIVYFYKTIIDLSSVNVDPTLIDIPEFVRTASRTTKRKALCEFESPS